MERGALLFVRVKPLQNYKIQMKHATNDEKKSWGGKRAGAGRPSVSGSTRSISIRIPEDVAVILEGQDNRTAYIIEAIRAFEKSRQ